jgi:hypothetical protein
MAYQCEFPKPVNRYKCIHITKTSTQPKSVTEEMLSLPREIIWNENWNLWIRCPNTGARCGESSTNRRIKDARDVKQRKGNVSNLTASRTTIAVMRRNKLQMKYIYVCR